MRPVALSLLIFAVLPGSLPDVDARWWASNRLSSGTGGRSYYDDHYSDLKTKKDRVPTRNTVLRLPSQECGCKDGAAKCTGSPEPGWMVEDTVSAVCQVAAEVRLLRTQRVCALRRAMGGSLKAIKALRDNSVTGPCISLAMGEKTLKEEVFWGDGDDTWEEEKKKGDEDEDEDEDEEYEDEEEGEEEGGQGGGEEGGGWTGGFGIATGKDQKAAVLLEMQATALLVASRAASATVRSKMWPGPTREVFYTQSNAENQRGHVDPLDTSSRGFLPREQPARRYGSCVVVGNSGGKGAIEASRRPFERLPTSSAASAETLLKAKLGPEIDGHDFVIRINQAPAAGNYGIHAGERTGARFLNRKLTEVYAEAKGRPWLYDDPDGTLLIASRASTKHFRELAVYVAGNHTDKEILFANSRLVSDGLALLSSFRQAMQVGLKSAIGGRKPVNPSSGFLAVQLASHLCNTINITGFSLGTPAHCRSGTHDCGKGQKFHYFHASMLGRFDRPGLAEETKKHQLGLEGWLLKAYHVLGLVCIFPVPLGLGPCGSRLGGLFGEGGSISTDWPSVHDLLADKRLATLLKWQPPKERPYGKDLAREQYMKSWVVTPGLGLEKQVEEDHWDKGHKMLKPKDTADNASKEAVHQDKPAKLAARGLLPPRHRYQGSPADQ